MTAGDCDEFDETTDRREVRHAREAVTSARRSRADTDAIVAEANRALATLRAMHERNHYVEKFQDIIRESHV